MMANVAIDDRWLICPKPNPKAALRLFCIPYAGGNAAVYQHWHRWLPSNVEVFAVQLPGRGNRLLEQLCTELDDLTESIIQAIMPYLDRPFALFGHSMGAMLGYEVACKLEDRRLGHLNHLFVSAFRAVHMPRENRYRHLLSDTELMEELRELNGTPEILLKNQELMELFLPIIRADLRLCDTYSHRRNKPLNCGLTAFGGEKDAGIGLDEIHAWKDLTAGAFEQYPFPGDHFFIHSDEQSVLRTVSELLHKLI